jgi:SAM-dependent methyltransferase
MPEGVAAPSSWVLAGLRPLPAGSRVLDFACGRGRHALAAQALGHAVVAADRDAEALEGLRAEAARWAGPPERAPKSQPAGPEPILVCADLEADPWPFEPASFDAVVVCNYLFRSRIDELPALLRPGGVLIYETFARGNEHYGRPSRPDFLLMPGELMDWAGRAGLHRLAFEDGFVGGARRARIQRLRALRLPADLEAFALE